MEIYLERIKPLFKSSGKSNLELEKDIGLPRSIIYDWDNKRSKSYKNYADKIASYFNVSTDYLLGNTDIKNKPATDKGNELSDDDAQLLKLFNQVPEESKALVVGMIEAALKSHGLLK